MYRVHVANKDITKSDAKQKTILRDDRNIDEIIDEVRFAVEDFKNIDDVVVSHWITIRDFDYGGDNIQTQEIITIKKGESLENTFFYQELKTALIY